MSHSDSNKDRKRSYCYNFYNRGNRPKNVNLDKFERYSKNFQYYSNKYNYRTSWQRRPPRRLPWRQHEKERPQSPSSFSGTEEYALKKIQETSEEIKKRLMMPESDDSANKPTSSVINTVEIEPNEQSRSENDKSSPRLNKKSVSYNVGEIHDKIMTHLTKLSHSKKMNLIYARSSGYDGVIQQIYKQKRLELSKALRDMCSNQTAANSEIINSIIPDIGIKIEDLPLEMIQELSSTLDWNFEDCSSLQNYEETGSVTTEVFDNATLTFPNILDDRFTEDSEVNNFNSNVFNHADIDEPQEVVETDVASSSFPKNKDSCSSTSVLQDEPNLMDTDDILIKNIKQETLNFDFKDADPLNDEVSSDDFIEDRGKVKICQIKEEPVGVKTEACDGNDPSDFFKAPVPYRPIESKCNKSTNENVKTECQDKQIQANFLNETASKKSQTLGCRINSVGVQTDINISESRHFNIETEKICNLDDAIEAMLKIDQEILRLTTLRQSLFFKIQKDNNTNKSTKDVKQIQPSSSKKIPIKNVHDKGSLSQKCVKKVSCAKMKNINFRHKEAINLEEIPEKVLVLKLIEDKLLAATEGGNIFYINIQDGTISSTIKLSQQPITTIQCWVTAKNNKHLLVGSLDTMMYELNFETRKQFRSTKIKHGVQCLDIKWNCVFIGTTDGNLVRYSLTRSKIEFRDNISPQSIMVLKAAQEGARHVLLVATRDAPVCIRDARSCLILRVMTECITPTVYSLILEKNMVYCGTTFHDLLVYSFHDGNLVHRFEATNSKGICCMKVVKNLLFASCHDGNIYVYNVKNHKFVGTIPGPGGVILAMEVVNNIVIVGTISLNMKSMLIPEFILEQNKI